MNSNYSIDFIDQEKDADQPFSINITNDNINKVSFQNHVAIDEGSTEKVQEMIF